MINIRQNPKEVIFIDIETIKESKSLFDLKANKAIAFKNYVDNSSLFEDKSDISKAWKEGKIALMPEFSKIICISIGIIDGATIKIKSYFSTVDKEILTLKEFIDDLIKILKTRKWLCGHNIINFDMPFLIRRCIVNQIKVPYELQMHEKKPWELNFIDTMQIWKCGSYSLGTANLETICVCLGLDSPKETMSGKDISDKYFESKDKFEFLKEVSEYCSGDVLSVIKLFYKYQGLNIPDKIEYK